MKVFKTALLGIILSCLAQTIWATEIFHRDTVSINGQVILIRADVEIDTLLMTTDKWIDDLEMAGLLVFGTNFQSSFNEFDDYYTQSSYVRFPEVGIEFNHPFNANKSKQFHYRAGVTVGLMKYMEIDPIENLIGFHYDGSSINQLSYIPDSLGNEPKDTISVETPLKPLPRINLGIEWHGVMRKARGWRIGLMLELTPIQNQLVNYEKPPLTAIEWDDVDPGSTYSIDNQSSKLCHVKMFYSWSPWNSQVFFRNSWVWSPNNLQTAFTLGYHF